MEKSAVSGFTRATDEDVKKFQALAYQIIYDNYFGDELSFEEKMTAGMLGVAKGLESFEPSRGVTRAYWVAWNIKKDIREETRRSSNQRRYAKDENWQRSWLEARRSRGNDETSNLALKLRDIDEEKKRSIVERVSECLNDDERRCVQGIVYRSLTQKELADEMGVSQSWISRVWRDSVKKMKDKAGELDDWL